jgi:hypothetical protein
VVGGSDGDTEIDFDNRDNAVVVSENALGQGVIDDLSDIVYIPDQSFDRNRTIEIAGEIDKINRKLKDEGKGYVLIGPGRWGTADRWFGIPVSWSQISGVKVIVETDIQGVAVQTSQGAHFFHNITSFGIPYFTVNRHSKADFLNSKWLESIEPANATEHVRHIRLDGALRIAVDGKGRRGVIRRSGK